MEFLYDRTGTAVVHVESNVLYLISGQPVAFLHNEYVYAYSGRQIGTYEDGRVRDMVGACAFYSEKHSGFGPIAPVRRIPPIPAIHAIPPIPPIPNIPKVKAVPTSSWSKLSGKQFFE